MGGVTVKTVPIFAAIILALSGLVETKTDNTRSLNLIPWPRDIVMHEGRRELSDRSTIVVSDASLLPLAEVLQNGIYLSTGVRPSVKKGKTGTIILTLDTGLEKEAYRLSVGRNAVLAGRDYKALALATATLLQLIEVKDGRVSLHGISIQDEPYAGFRGYQMCIKHQPHPFYVIKQGIDMCYLYKINYFMLHMSGCQWYWLLSESFRNNPTRKIRGENGVNLELDELKTLIQYAEARGITMIPQYGAWHGYHYPEQFPAVYPEFFKEYKDYDNKKRLMLDHPNFWKAMEKMLGDMADLFKTSPYIHLAAIDGEVPDFGRTRLERAFLKKHGLRNSRDFYRWFLVECDKIIKKNGKNTMCWEGFRRDHTSPVQVPKDVVVTEYIQMYYRPDHVIEDGYSLVNCTQTPLYAMVGNCPKWSYKEIYDWNMYQFGSTHMQRYSGWDKIIRHEVSPTNKVIGALLSTWEQHGIHELPISRMRLAAMSERVWDHDGDTNAPSFDRRLMKTDRLLEKIIAPVNVHEEGLYETATPDYVVQSHWFGSRLKITMDPAIKNAVARYTLDGTEPDTNSTAYEKPIVMDKTTTLKAALFSKDGKQLGDTFWKKYEHHPVQTGKTEGLFMDKLPSDRLFRPNIFGSEMTFTLKSKMKGGTIRYQTNSKTVKKKSPVYTEPVTITKPTRIRARYFNDKEEPMGEEFAITFNNHNYIKSLTTGWKITASVSPPGHGPENAVDGMVNKSFYWDGNPAPQWIMVTLPFAAEVGSMDLVTYWDGRRYYQYCIEVSLDENTWTKVVDMSTNTAVATEKGYHHEFEPVTCRYMKVTMLKNSANPGLHIVEFRAFGPEGKKGEGD
jgi:hexosaminidase